MPHPRPVTPATLLGVLGAAALALAACGDDGGGNGSDEISLITSGTLTVCTDAPYEPFEYQDDDGTWTGFDMELMREIATRMELDLEVIEQPFEGIWLAPAAGACDIVASAMTITEERAENALFSDPYFEADQSLLVTEEGADGIGGLDDLGGRSIGVQSGTTGATYAEDHAPEDATIREYDDEAEIFAALDAGDIDAVLQDLPVNGFRADENDLYEVVDTYPTGEEYGFAATLDSRPLIEAVNDALAGIRSDGTWDELFDEWIPAEWYGDDGDRDSDEGNSEGSGDDDGSDDGGTQE